MKVVPRASGSKRVHHATGAMATTDRNVSHLPPTRPDRLLDRRERVRRAMTAKGLAPGQVDPLVGVGAAAIPGPGLTAPVSRDKVVGSGCQVVQRAQEPAKSTRRKRRPRWLRE